MCLFFNLKLKRNLGIFEGRGLINNKGLAQKFVFSDMDITETSSTSFILAQLHIHWLNFIYIGSTSFMRAQLHLHWPNFIYACSISFILPQNFIYIASTFFTMLNFFTILNFFHHAQLFHHSQLFSESLLSQRMVTVTCNIDYTQVYSTQLKQAVEKFSIKKGTLLF